MKRIIAIILATALLLLLSGCVQQKPPETVFWLDKVEDVGTFEGLEKFERYYDGYTDELIPSDKYGELIPFVGKILTASGDWPMTSERYGLCTTDGKIVVDPVFEYCYMMQAGGVAYYNLAYARTIEEIETAQENEDFDAMYSNRNLLIRTDGSFCKELGEATANAWTLDNGEGRIAVSKYGQEMDSSGMHFEVYDENMNLLYTLEKIYNYPTFSNELIDVMIAGENWQPSAMYYIDKNGNKVIDGSAFSQISPFYNGLASVQDKESGLYGYIDTNGDYVIEPQFKYASQFGKLGYANVETDEGYFVIDVHGSRVLGDNVYEGAYLMEDGRVYNAGTRVRKFIDVTTKDYLKCPICGKNSDESKMNMSYLNNGIAYIHTNCDGKTGVFNAEGTLKEHIDYTNISGEFYIEHMDDSYIFIRDTTADTGIIMYDRGSGEVKFTPENDTYFHTALDEGRYVMMSYEESMYEAKTTYHIYENGQKTDGREYEHFGVAKTADGTYFNAVSNGFSYVYDEDFKVIMKISISDND
ncbi:MAG: WG repeat-containing protein [Clostridia bacterium]|nr:WG repeat-containing protein [Clostridia bacterium]